MKSGNSFTCKRLLTSCVTPLSVNFQFEIFKRHGAGQQPCPNDMSLEALALYIYTNVVRKISIGSPENSTKVFSCGFSSVFRKERACIHGGDCADTNKCIYVHTKSLDPVWSPMCVRCMGKANPIDFSTVLRMPPQSKRGRVHCKIMTIIEKALAASL